VSVARFIADQRTKYLVPHAVVCAVLGISVSWFYKWLGRAQGPAADSGRHTTRDRRRHTVDLAVAVAFSRARGLHGSPRLHADLCGKGWTVSEKTVADSMRRQSLVARRIQTAQRVDQTGQEQAGVPRPAASGLHRRGAQHPLGG